MVTKKIKSRIRSKRITKTKKKTTKKINQQKLNQPKKQNQASKNESMIEDLLIIKSISRDLNKISDSYNLEKKTHDSSVTNKKQSFLGTSKIPCISNEKERLEQHKNDIYKLTYLIYKVSNKVLVELE